MAKKHAPKGLTPKQERFIAEYLIDLNGTQAAIRAGYSAKTAGVQAEALLRKPEIERSVKEGQAKRLDKAELTAVRVLEEMRRLAFSDVRQLFDASGNLKPLHELTAEESACIASLEVIIKNAQAGDGKTDTVHKLRVWDKPRVLEMLGKHFALLTERVELSGDAALMARLLAGRNRLKR
jgi:phage terminase small subunit